MNILKKAGIGLISAGIIASIAAFGLNGSSSKSISVTEETVVEPRASNSHLLHPTDANGNILLEDRIFMYLRPYIDMYPADGTKQGTQGETTYKYMSESTTGTLGKWANRSNWKNVSLNYTASIPRQAGAYEVTGVKSVVPFYLTSNPLGTKLTYPMVKETHTNTSNLNLKSFKWTANPATDSIVGSGVSSNKLYVMPWTKANESKIEEVFTYTSESYSVPTFTYNHSTKKVGIGLDLSPRGTLSGTELNAHGDEWTNDTALATRAQDDAMSIIKVYKHKYGYKQQNVIDKDALGKDRYQVLPNGQKGEPIYNWYGHLMSFTPPAGDLDGWEGSSISGSKTYAEWLSYWKSHIVNSNTYLFRDLWNQQYLKTISYSSYRLYMPLLLELSVKSAVDFQMITEKTDTAHNPNNVKCSAEYKDGKLYVDLISVLSSYPFNEEVSTVTLTITDKATGTKYYQGKSNLFEHTLNKPTNLAQSGVSFSQIASSTLSNPTAQNGKYTFTIPSNFNGKELCIEATVNASNYPVETDDRTNNTWKQCVKISVPDLIFKNISHRVISETKTSFKVNLTFKTRDEKTEDLTISQSPVSIKGNSNRTSVTINNTYHHPFKNGDYFQTLEIDIPKIGTPGASQTITITGIINPNKNAPLVPTVEPNFDNNKIDYTFTLTEEEEEEDIPIIPSSIPNIDELPTDTWREQCVISLNKDKSFYNLIKKGTFTDEYPASILSFTDQPSPGPYMTGTLSGSSHDKFIMSAYPCEDAYSNLMDYYHDEQEYVHFKGYTNQFFTSGSTELKDTGTVRKLITRTGSRCPEYEEYWCDNCEEYHTRHNHYEKELWELTDVRVSFKIAMSPVTITDLYDFESKDQKIRAGYGFYTRIQTSYSTDMDSVFQSRSRYESKAHISRRIDVKTDKLNLSGSIIQLEPAGGGTIFPTVYETRHNKQSKYQHRKTFMNENTPDGDYPVIADVIVALPSFSPYLPNDPCATKIGTKYLGTYGKDSLTVVGSMYDDSYPTVGKTDSDKQ